MSKFIELYEQTMEACGATFITDPHGKRLAIPPNHELKVDPDGEWIVVSKRLKPAKRNP